MDFKHLQSRLASEHITAAPKADPDDVLKGLKPEDASKKAEEILRAALDAERKIAELKAELAPILKIATTLGASRRFQQMVAQTDSELVRVGALFVKLQETSGSWRTGTQEQLIDVVKKTNPELEELLKTAQTDAKTFSQGSSKVMVWDKQPEDQRKKAPFEVKLASFDKDAGIWDALKSVVVSIGKLSDGGRQWLNSLFATVYETHFANLNKKLRQIGDSLEAVLAHAS